MSKEKITAGESNGNVDMEMDINTESDMDTKLL